MNLIVPKISHFSMHFLLLLRMSFYRILLLTSSVIHSTINQSELLAFTFFLALLLLLVTCISSYLDCENLEGKIYAFVLYF